MKRGSLLFLGGSRAGLLGAAAPNREQVMAYQQGGASPAPTINDGD